VFVMVFKRVRILVIEKKAKPRRREKGARAHTHTIQVCLTHLYKKKFVPHTSAYPCMSRSCEFFF